MTTTAEDTAGTAELNVQVAPGALALVTGAKPFTIAKLLDAMATPPLPEPSAEPFPPAAPKVELTTELVEALRALPGLFGALQVGERRLLTEEELKQLTQEYIAISAVATQLGSRQEAIKVTVAHHIDVRAEEKDGVVAQAVKRAGKVIKAATARITVGKHAGHYALAQPGKPVEVEVPGFQDSWQLKHVKGATAPNGKLLDQLLADGKVTRAEYLAITSSQRSFDADKLAIALRKDPGRFLEILTAITETGPAGASLVSPKK